MHTDINREMESPAPKPISPCWKKKAAPDSAFMANVKDHLGQFVRASMDEHRICLKRTIRDLREYAKLKKQAKVISTASRVATAAVEC